MEFVNAFIDLNKNHKICQINKNKTKQKQKKTTITTTQFRDITKFLNTAQMLIYSRAKLTFFVPFQLRMLNRKITKFGNIFV